MTSDEQAKPCGIDDHDWKPEYRPDDPYKTEPVANVCRLCGTRLEVWD